MLIAIDIERVPGEGGLEELLESLIYNCEYMNIPIIYSHRRQHLGRIIKNKAVSLSCVGIVDYSGVEDAFNQIVQLSNDLKELYEQEYEQEYVQEYSPDLPGKIIYSNSQINFYPDFSYLMHT